MESKPETWKGQKPAKSANIYQRQRRATDVGVLKWKQSINTLSIFFLQIKNKYIDIFTNFIKNSVTKPVKISMKL